MIKTVIIPQNNRFNLDIPANYIGKKIEILLYALDEVIETEKNIKKPSDFLGIFNEEEATNFEQHIEQMRKEWDRTI